MRGISYIHAQETSDMENIVTVICRNAPRNSINDKKTNLIYEKCMPIRPGNFDLEKIVTVI